MSTTPALLVAAAGVGLGHAVMPDHWAPLALMGRTRRYPLAKVARLSGLAGVAHVVVSLVLGAIVVAVGLQLRTSVEHAQDTVVGVLLIGTGVAFAVLELTGVGHGHVHLGAEHDHPHGPGHSHGHVHAPAAAKRSRLASLAGIAVPFGAAASPDLTILPVFLAASTAGAGVALGSLLVFSAVTVATIVGLTVIATFSGYQLGGRWLERWGNLLTAAMLVVIGGLVLGGVV